MSREKQIEEMAREICSEYDCVIPCQSCAYYGYANCRDVKSAEKLYNAGYRKQSDGEWLASDVLRGDEDWKRYACSLCKHMTDAYYKDVRDLSKFCPNCGAKMKGGAE